MSSDRPAKCAFSRCLVVIVVGTPGEKPKARSAGKNAECNNYDDADYDNDRNNPQRRPEFLVASLMTRPIPLAMNDWAIANIIRKFAGPLAQGVLENQHVARQ